MMQVWLIFGGPYSNLHAVRALRAEAERRGIPPSRVICTGDVVAYCAEPEETVRAIRGWGCLVISGNCETQLASGEDDCGCGFDEGTVCHQLSDSWYTFAKARISAESRAWMAGLPPSLRLDIAGHRVRVIHGGLSQNNRFVFASDTRAIDEELAAADADLVIAGHCGLPFVTNRPAGVWFNPGVIGMPANDGRPETWFGLATETRDGLTLETRPLAYDPAGAAALMRSAKYAEPYAAAILSGLWPSLDVLPAAERALSRQRIEPIKFHLAHAAPRRP